MSWRGGYVADIAYGSGVYLETAPAHLSLSALLGGVRAPDPGRPFRYLELGCGTGLGLGLMAAANPHAQFLGVDFNPAHVAAAERLIEAAGLDNLVVREASFADLAAAPPPAGQRFDYVAAHGVWTWVAREVQQDIVRLLDGWVSPGGLVYLGYNNMAGWASTLSLQQVLSEHARRTPGDSLAKIRAAVGFALSLREAAPRGLDFARLEQALGPHLDTPEAAPPTVMAYLAHEYMNDHWRPVFPTEVEADLAEAKLAYVATASLLELWPELALTAAEAHAAGAYEDAAGRRRLGDLLGLSSFRQDVFVRGATPLHPPMREAMLRDLTLMLVERSDEVELATDAVGGRLELDATVYKPIYERLTQGPARVGDLVEIGSAAGGRISAQELLVVMCGSRNAATVARPEAMRDAAADRARARRFNLAMMQMLREQAGQRLALASPMLGSGLAASPGRCMGWLTQAAPELDDSALRDEGVRKLGRECAAFWRASGVL